MLAAAAAVLVPAPALATGSSEPDDTTPAASASENPFLPDDTSVNLGDCVSALPRPECGSKERGGWRQLVVFGAVVGGLGVIGTRIFIQMNRRRREQTHPPAEPPA
jgi:hypothetical protein